MLWVKKSWQSSCRHVLPRYFRALLSDGCDGKPKILQLLGRFSPSKGSKLEGKWDPELFQGNFRLVKYFSIWPRSLKGCSPNNGVKTPDFMVWFSCSILCFDWFSSRGYDCTWAASGAIMICCLSNPYLQKNIGHLEGVPQLYLGDLKNHGVSLLTNSEWSSNWGRTCRCNASRSTGLCRRCSISEGTLTLSTMMLP